ncbi:uncharacterized protein METZ01_LOCUS459498 [marine metagenome]|uniref:Uncharacterized protein n=1 Tax=marine metagenome TaxID=408172 RepID=A0A383AG55_9ZZZZ
MMHSRIGNYLLCVGITATLIGGLVTLLWKWRMPKPFVWNAQ